jgi:hypothetical protein
MIQAEHAEFQFGADAPYDWLRDQLLPVCAA